MAGYTLLFHGQVKRRLAGPSVVLTDQLGQRSNGSLRESSHCRFVLTPSYL